MRPFTADRAKAAEILLQAPKNMCGVVTPPYPLISVVCVTSRARFLGSAMANYRRQAYPNRELILIVNTDDGLSEIAIEACADLHQANVVEAPAISVGACRNLGVDAANGAIVAMFDDDDLYGPNYLTEAVALLVQTGAQMVGKLSYIWIDGSLGVFRYCRPPGPWSESIPTLSGNTQVFPRSVHAPFLGLDYSDSSLGEDYHFSRAIASAGGLLLSSGPDNFIRRRNLDPEHRHLWNGHAPGFDLQAHEQLTITHCEAERLAGIRFGDEQ